MGATLLLLARRDGDTWRLLAPDTGLFTRALDRGAALAPGQDAGVLLRLGTSVRLIVPAGVHGVVANARPERVHAPVGHSDLLYEVAAQVAADAAPIEAAEGDASRALVLESPQSGRFYHRSAPGAAPFVQPGDPLEAGTPVGLIEVMKTFAHVAYRPDGGLPERARVVRLIAGDGVDVRAGDPLVEIEAL